MANSKTSVPSGKQPTTKTAKDETVMPQDALEALRSAIELCRTAGMNVRAGNSSKTGALVVAISGAMYHNGGFVPMDLQSRRDVPQPVPQPGGEGAK